MVQVFALTIAQPGVLRKESGTSYCQVRQTDREMSNRPTQQGRTNSYALSEVVAQLVYPEDSGES